MSFANLLPLKTTTQSSKIFANLNASDLNEANKNNTLEEDEINEDQVLYFNKFKTFSRVGMRYVSTIEILDLECVLLCILR